MTPPDLIDKQGGDARENEAPRHGVFRAAGI